MGGNIDWWLQRQERQTYVVIKINGYMWLQRLLITKTGGYKEIHSGG
jgi:hypothetical protein